MWTNRGNEVAMTCGPNGYHSRGRRSHPRGRAMLLPPIPERSHSSHLPGASGSRNSASRNRDNRRLGPPMLISMPPMEESRDDEGYRPSYVKDVVRPPDPPSSKLHDYPAFGEPELAAPHAFRSHNRRCAQTNHKMQSGSTKSNPEILWDEIESLEECNPPEISSMPTDEISASCTKGRPNTQPETRDRFQLSRLQARINRRRELHCQSNDDDDGPNYNKSLRSSRIKTVRSLYSNRDPDNQDLNGDSQSRACGSISNSSIPSIKKGQAMSRSDVDSGAQSIQNNGAGGDDLSEYRSKFFDKMFQMLQDVPTKEGISFEDAASVIKDRLIDEGRASCCSIEELKLIELMAEEEMSRILHEFEMNNSLVENTGSVVEVFPDIGNVHVARNKEEICHPPVSPPKKIIYHDNGMSISSIFSDVTVSSSIRLSKSQTTLTEFDDMTSPHQIYPKRRLPPTLSPAAAAAASVAASANYNRDRGQQHLPCVLEAPDTFELNEDDELQSEKNQEREDDAKGDVGENARVLKADALLTFRRADKAEHFHDGILSAVAKASAQQVEEVDELNEVISILSQYEEAEKKLKVEKRGEKAKDKEKAEEKEAKPVKAPLVEENVTPFDETHVSHNICGCIVQ